MNNNNALYVAIWALAVAMGACLLIWGIHYPVDCDFKAFLIVLGAMPFLLTVGVGYVFLLFLFAELIVWLAAKIGLIK
jgi:hypothetical protein